MTGVLVLEIPADSALAQAGLRRNDVILSLNEEKTPDTTALLRHTPATPTVSPSKIGISRDQRDIVLLLIPSSSF